MLIGKRLFPYPILNNNKNYSQYDKSSYSFSYEEVVTTDEFILKNICYSLEDSNLKSLIDQGKAKAVCVIECPKTRFRKLYDISDKPQDIKLSLFDLNEKITVSSVVIATQDINDFSSSEFNDDYKPYKFEIEKSDILAVDDGYTNRVDFGENIDDKKSSIFLVIKDSKLKNGEVVSDFDSNKITIHLPTKQWDNYEVTKNSNDFQSFYFSILAIPALLNALSTLQKDIEIGKTTLDVLCMDNNWLNSFKNSFELKYGIELTEDRFMSLDLYKECQKLFDFPITKSLDKIFDLAVGINKGDEEND